MEDVFAVQDEIARSIAEALKVRLLPAQEDVAGRARDGGRRGLQPLPEGPLLLQPARGAEGDRGVRGALARGPALRARLHGPRRLVLHLRFLRRRSRRSTPARRRARPRARRRSSSPTPSDVHVSLALVEHYYGWDIEREEQHFRRAIELAPKAAGRIRGSRVCCPSSPRTEEALEVGRRAVELEPLSANVHVNASRPHFWPRATLAIEGFRKAVDVDSSSVYALFALGIACQAAGRHDEGISALEKLAALTDREMSWALCLLASSLATSGPEADAARILRSSTRWPRGYVPPMHVAFARAARRDRRDGRAARARARRAQHPLLGLVAFGPVFDPAVGPRVQKLIAAIRPE